MSDNGAGAGAADDDDDSSLPISFECQLLKFEFCHLFSIQLVHHFIKLFSFMR